METIIFCSFFVLVYSVRRFVLHTAWRGIQGDKVKYDKIFEKTMALPPSEQAREKLSELTDMYGCHGMPLLVQHTVLLRKHLVHPHFREHTSAVRRTSHIFDRVLRRGNVNAKLLSPSRGDPIETEVTSLDQLYLQAKLVSPVFVKLVHTWAFASNGKVKVVARPFLSSASTAEGEHCACAAAAGTAEAATTAVTTTGTGVEADVESGWLAGGRSVREGGKGEGERGKMRGGGGGANEKKAIAKEQSALCYLKDVDISQNRVKWASLKGVSRAIEKVARSYGHKPSRLVDVVRQSIIFSNLDDLCNCLQILSRDPATRILRIKNRFAREYDSNETAGYRDVAVNVVMVNEETSRLGVAGHVCELQLILEQFLNLKTDDGHKRYVEYRNKCAE